MKMRKKDLKIKYTERYSTYLCNISELLLKDIKENISDYPRIDRVCVRAKSIKRFLDKASKKESNKIKYTDPLNQIQDQIGARIITYYLQDVEMISKILEKYYKPIEKQKIFPDSEREFGYECKHYILFLPENVLPDGARKDYPRFFELQIRTLFQHAWAEAEHDITYKTLNSVGYEDKKEMAFAAAQAWGADRIFDKYFTSSRGVKRVKG